MLDLLPNEILVEVFDFLPAKDLLNLTLTSKLFNDLISSTAALTNHLEINFVSEHKNLPWTALRRYSKIYLEGSNAKFFVPIFAQIHENLREICIICVKMEGNVLKEILNLCTKLRKIILKDNRISYTNEDFEEPLPKLQLENFQYRNFTDQATKVFKIFKECQVKEFHVLGFTASCCDMRNFLVRQKGLRTFALHDSDSGSRLFDEEEIRDVSFSLSKLKLDSFSLGPENSLSRLNFQGFISNFQHSLTHLELNDMSHEIFKFFVNFPHLKYLKVFDTKFEDSSSQLPQVTNLTIGYDIAGKWAEKFPNVKNLSMVWVRYQRDFLQLQELKKLEKLKISNFSIIKLSIPSVRSLTLSTVGFADEEPFDYNQNQIEELFLDDCSQVEWLMNFLACDNVKLKILRISRTEISEKCKNFLESCRNKIQSLQIVR